MRKVATIRSLGLAIISADKPNTATQQHLTEANP